MDMSDKASKRLDDAARAAWLYYISGKTQDEIAQIMGVSRQSAQRLVSLAMSSGLVKVRIDHPISRCLSLARKLREQLGLAYCDVVPTLPGDGGSLGSVANATADVIERWLSSDSPIVMGLGTGRTLRAAIEQLPRISCDQNRKYRPGWIDCVLQRVVFHRGQGFCPDLSNSDARNRGQRARAGYAAGTENRGENT